MAFRRSSRAPTVRPIPTRTPPHNPGLLSRVRRFTASDAALRVTGRLGYVTTSEHVEQFRATAVSWQLASGDPGEANKLFKKQQALALELRKSADGRLALEDLAANDDDAAVRLLAATASLKWESAVGIRSLGLLVGAGGILAIDAEMVLREYRSGRLNLDWE